MRFLQKCVFLFLSIFLYTINARPLHILFVVGYFPVSSETFILNQITSLIDKGHTVSIFSFKKGEETYRDPLIEKYRLLDRTWYEEFPHHLSDVDIVFCQFGYHGRKIVDMPELSEWLCNKKIVTCFRGSDITVFAQKKVDIYKELFERGDLFLPVCEYFKHKLINIGCNPEKIIVHHSAIDCSRFVFQKKQKKCNEKISLILTARLIEKKGIDDAIKAIAYMYGKQYRNLEFIIVGDGPERSYLEKMVKALQLQSVVKFIGWASHERVVELLKKADIFLLPSVTAANGNEEGIPNAVKEAMAVGVLPIITRHAGNAELVEDGISGFLVSERNPRELAEKIMYAITHQHEWKKMARAARKKIEQEFEIIKTVERLEQIFYQLLSREPQLM